MAVPIPAALQLILRRLQRGPAEQTRRAGNPLRGKVLQNPEPDRNLETRKRTVRIETHSSLDLDRDSNCSPV